MRRPLNKYLIISFFAVCTVAVLIFGEITPKSLANDFPEKFAMFSAPLIRSFIWLLMPLNLIFSGWKKLVDLVVRVKDDEEDDNMAQEELLLMVEEPSKRVTLTPTRVTFLETLLSFLT